MGETLGIFIEIEGQIFPFEIERIDDKGMFIHELRPYWISSLGYLDLDNNKFKVVRNKRKIQSCEAMKKSRERHIFPEVIKEAK